MVGSDGGIGSDYEIGLWDRIVRSDDEIGWWDRKVGSDRMMRSD
jgi:hypothetical protein